MDFVKNFKVTKEPGSQVKVEGEIPFEELEKNRKNALTKLGGNIELPGFRKGHVPEAMLVAHIGEMTILTEMAERALATVYPHILTEHKIDALGYPKLNITKIAPQNPLGFSLLIATIPEVTLPDFKKIAKEANKAKESDEVSETEVETQIKDIQRQKLAYERLQQKAGGQTHAHADGSVHDGPAHDEGEEHAHEEVKAVTDADLPPLIDEYVAGLGQKDQFKTVGDFKEKVKEHLQIQKRQDVKARHRGLVTDKIIEGTTVELPHILIDTELNQMSAQMEDDITRAGLKLEDYLRHIKKTKEELYKEWTPAAEKRAKLQLVLNEIAKKEEVKIDQVQLDTQVKSLMDQYKDADETRVRIYVTSVMQNEAVMQMLESL
jgi:trigger factor